MDDDVIEPSQQGPEVPASRRDWISLDEARAESAARRARMEAMEQRAGTWMGRVELLLGIGLFRPSWRRR